MTTSQTAPVEKRADTLHRAAEKARTLANAATEGPWYCDADSGVDDLHFGHMAMPVLRGPNTYGPNLADTQHMASWHPDVARAAADMLEEFARLDDQGIHPPTSVVTLAKRYLGDAS